MKSLKEMLDQRPDLQPYLFCRGFLITDQKLNLMAFPFNGHWSSISLGCFTAYIHEKKQIYSYQNKEKIYFLIGHAYDPFSMQYNELNLLIRMATASNKWTELSNWTGVFCVGYVEGNTICFTSDAAGQQLIYYGGIGDHVYITSHSQLVGELFGIKQSEYIRKLRSIRFFHAFGYVLPGDLSPFTELRRAQCNFYTEMGLQGIRTHRFWPTEEPNPAMIQDMADVIHNNLELISKKWPDRRAAISVTGGMDSKTTMACSKGLYDLFQYFSYDSLPDEKVDADAAHDLCEALGLEHKVYCIPTDNNQVNDYELWNKILYYNCGCIGYSNANDVRKRAFFAGVDDFEIEIKSWVDEIGRARYYKRFAKKSFPLKPTGRYLSTIYKPFITERKLLKQTDDVFQEYLEKYYSNDVFDLIPWWDLVYWEFEWNAAEGAFLTGEQVLSYDITIPFNNRRLLAMMLSVPLQMRINDEIQKKIIHLMNSQIEQTGIHVQDVSHTKKRALMERAYLEINTRIPF